MAFSPLKEESLVNVPQAAVKNVGMFPEARQRSDARVEALT
ncbi:hypothetical protein [Rhodopseudomonas sp. P2A-2r]|nr:hypothetical protein [Rhodopseudomonas sp. P2A-2r]UZE46832.1 hypothetical protein ONR75_17435 [Rhodopseudomonas sp. P2A-2r]